MTCNHELVWHNCYKSGFDLISPDSFAHPAKMSASLCYRILDHLKELGLLNDCDTILDPMSGTGLTAICANAKGYRAVTIELEERFIGFQLENKEYAGRKLQRELDWQIIQGDARKLSEILTEQGIITVTSPPYAEAQTGGGIAVNGYTGDKHSPTDLVGKRSYMPDTHGTTPGQIGNLKDTPLKVITSPPYAEMEKRNRSTDSRWDEEREKKFSGGAVNISKGYQASDENIGNLADRPLKTVTSPPYDGQVSASNSDPHPEKQMSTPAGRQYGHTEGQLGDTQSESYLEAMRQVYSEIAKVSDVLAIVLKNPTRNGQLRRLDLDTIRILEETNWTIHCQHQALLFEELEREDMFSGPQKKVNGRMSFFKRLSWQKGQPVAAWEDVIIAVRNGGGNLKVVTSPPYESTEIAIASQGDKDKRKQRRSDGTWQGYGDTPGQIGKLKDK